jgi:hypothetical protein
MLTELHTVTTLTRQVTAGRKRENKNLEIGYSWEEKR